MPPSTNLCFSHIQATFWNRYKKVHANAKLVYGILYSYLIDRLEKAEKIVVTYSPAYATLRGGGLLAHLG